MKALKNLYARLYFYLFFNYLFVFRSSRFITFFKNDCVYFQIFIFKQKRFEFLILMQFLFDRGYRVKDFQLLLANDYFMEINDLDWEALHFIFTRKLIGISLDQKNYSLSETRS